MGDPCGPVDPLVLIFIFQGDKIINHQLHILLIPMPLDTPDILCVLHWIDGNRELAELHKNVWSMVSVPNANTKIVTAR
ncbi:hypothetical protein [Methanolobus sp.]|uniref:hypothetical protein n=1 Tax=Methanolobus sp. TaxID=1874737 RepID=UPI0025CC5413|nr:hypothetical protein [Methanolobus sp.]